MIWYQVLIILSFILLIAIIVLVSLIYAQGFNQNKIIHTFNVGVNPAGMALTPNQNYLYVANNNNDEVSNEDTVSVIDLKKNFLLTTIFDVSFSGPYTITMNESGTLAYVTNSNSTTISVVDTSLNAVIDTITGFHEPSGLTILPGLNIGYVNNYSNSTVSVINLETKVITDTITVGNFPAAITCSPDGSLVYVINYVNGAAGTGTLSVIRTSDNTVTHTITGFSGPYGITVLSDGLFAYVTNFGSNNFTPIGRTISIVDLTTNSIVNTIATGGLQPAGITSKGKYIYVTNYNTFYNVTDLIPGEGTVNVIDTSTNKICNSTVIVGQSPGFVTVANNGLIYVSSYNANTVSQIDF